MKEHKETTPSPIRKSISLAALLAAAALILSATSALAQQIRSSRRTSSSSRLGAVISSSSTVGAYAGDNAMATAIPQLQRHRPRRRLYPSYRLGFRQAPTCTTSTNGIPPAQLSQWHVVNIAPTNASTYNNDRSYASGIPWAGPIRDGAAVSRKTRTGQPGGWLLARARSRQSDPTLDGGIWRLD